MDSRLINKIYGNVKSMINDDIDFNSEIAEHHSLILSTYENDVFFTFYIDNETKRLKLCVNFFDYELKSIGQIYVTVESVFKIQNYILGIIHSITTGD